MTVTYRSDSMRKFGGFVPLLFRWRGSVYKLLYKDTLIFFLIYFLLSILYRFLLSEGQRSTFEKTARFFARGTDMIPLTFILGFFVTLVVDRWWSNYIAIVWPDRAAIKIAYTIRGVDQRAKIIRRTLVRYLNLAHLVVLRQISSAVNKRFPTWDHVVGSGLMTESELKEYMNIKDKYSKLNVYWIPLMWANSLLAKAGQEGRINNEYHLRNLHKEIVNIRRNLGGLTDFDWITLPLVYTQVVSFAVYGFFATCLMARQHVTPDETDKAYNFDTYFPPFTFLQFVFYMGWIKVAQVLINPFGEDDDDFELNYLFDRHVQVSYLIVDNICNKVPLLSRDPHWKEEVVGIPHTVASKDVKTNGFQGSASNIEVPLHLHSIADATIAKANSSIFGRSYSGLRASSLSSNGIDSNGSQMHLV